MHDFYGTVHLIDEPDAVLDAKVTVDLNRVLIRAGDAEIGSWPHADLDIKKRGDGIHLGADKETLVLNIENGDFFLDLLGINDSPEVKKERRRRKKPVLMPDPPPTAPEGSKSKYVADDTTTASFTELRTKAAATYGDDTRLHRWVAIGLVAAVVMILGGAALTWGSARLLDPGGFPLGRLLAGFGGLAAMVGLYLAFFDARRITGSAVAIAAGLVVLAIMFFYSRAANLGVGFMIALLGSITLIIAGAVGMSDYGAAPKDEDEL